MAVTNTIDHATLMQEIQDINAILDVERNCIITKPQSIRQTLGNKIATIKKPLTYRTERTTMTELENVLQLWDSLFKSDAFRLVIHERSDLYEDLKITAVEAAMIGVFNWMNQDHDDEWADLEPVEALRRISAVTRKPEFGRFQRDMRKAGVGDMNLEPALERSLARFLEGMERSETIPGEKPEGETSEADGQQDAVPPPKYDSWKR